MAAARENFNMTTHANQTLSTQHSTWHSPIPYLFGGLAAMLGLIAFALLILACSYWKLSGYLENAETEQNRDLEAGDDENTLKQSNQPDNYSMQQDKFLVIMAGELKPTFLATPVLSVSSSFADSKQKSFCGCEEDESHRNSEEEKKENGGDHQANNESLNQSR